MRVNKSTIENMESFCADVFLPWGFIWRDMTLAEIGDKAQIKHLLSILEYYGGLYDKGRVKFRVHIEVDGENERKIPWELSEREKRNARIVNLKDEVGLTFTEIGDTVGMSLDGVKYAYKRAKGMPARKHGKKKEKQNEPI